MECAGAMRIRRDFSTTTRILSFEANNRTIQYNNNYYYILRPSRTMTNPDESGRTRLLGDIFIEARFISLPIAFLVPSSFFFCSTSTQIRDQELADNKLLIATQRMQLQPGICLFSVLGFWGKISMPNAGIMAYRRDLPSLPRSRVLSEEQ